MFPESEVIPKKWDWKAKKKVDNPSKKYMWLDPKAGPFDTDVITRGQRVANGDAGSPFEQSLQRIYDQDPLNSENRIVLLNDEYIKLDNALDHNLKPIKVEVPDDVWDELNINEYNNPYSDSLIDGIIYTKVNGALLDQTLTYNPKFPQYIIKIDTVMVNTVSSTIKTLKPSFSIDLGAEIGGTTEMFNFSPKVGFTSKSGFSYSYRYGVLDKTHNVGIMYKIKFRK